MNRILIKSLKRVLQSAVIVLIILSAINALRRNEGRSLNDFAVDTYIPSGMANVYRSHHWGFEKLWIYKISKKEIEEISVDLKKGHWQQLSKNDYENIRDFNSVLDFDIEKTGHQIDIQNTFYALYDCQDETYIEPRELSAIGDENHYCITIFIYDASNRYYYTIFGMA